MQTLMIRIFIRKKYVGPLKSKSKVHNDIPHLQKCFVKKGSLTSRNSSLWQTFHPKFKEKRRAAAEGRVVTSANWKSSTLDCEKSIKSRTEFTVDRRNGGSLTLRVSTFYDLHVLRTQSNFVKSIKTLWSTCS